MWKKTTETQSKSKPAWAGVQNEAVQNISCNYIATNFLIYVVITIIGADTD